MSEYKESKDNPLHKEFGLWSNIKYTMGKGWEYGKSAIILAAIGMVSSSILQYSWGVFSKYVLDIIEKNTDAETKKNELIMFLIIAGSIMAVLIKQNRFGFAHMV